MFKQAKAGGRLGARDRGSWLRPLAFGVYLASVTGQPTSVRGGLMPTDMTERPYNFAWGQQTPQKKTGWRKVGRAGFVETESAWI